MTNLPERLTPLHDTLASLHETLAWPADNLANTLTLPTDVTHARPQVRLWQALLVLTSFVQPPHVKPALERILCIFGPNNPPSIKQYHEAVVTALLLKQVKSGGEEKGSGTGAQGFVAGQGGAFQLGERGGVEWNHEHSSCLHWGC